MKKRIKVLVPDKLIILNSGDPELMEAGEAGEKGILENPVTVKIMKDGR